MAEIIDTEARQRIDQQALMLRDHDELFADIKMWAWGSPERGSKGIEQRMQEVEVTTRLVRFYGPIVVGLLAVIAAGQWPALAALLSLLF